MTSHPRKVYILTPNPAVDITYECPNPVFGEVNRVAQVTHRPGGKGLNVAAGVTALGHQAIATGFLGGHGGIEVQGLLEDTEIVQDWVFIDGETRSTIAIHAEDGTTMFNEPGPHVTSQSWQELEHKLAQQLHPGDVFVVSGSCPPQTKPEDLISVLKAAQAAGARTLVDMSGPLLIDVAAYADVLKPNKEELLAATGSENIHEGVEKLVRAGTQAIIVSDGPNGMSMFIAEEDQYLTATPPEFVHGNPTGAGDAAAAALAVDLLLSPTHKVPSANALASAVALSASAVLCPTAGEVDLSAYDNFLPRVIKEYRNASRSTV